MIKITFPELPYTELRPNYQKSNFWYKRAETTKIAREEAFLMCRNIVCPVKIDKCEIELVFTLPTKRRIDVGNLIAGCKAWLDGVVDSGIIFDDDWLHVTRLSGRPVYKKGVEQTEIIITPV
ncbi:MAG: hypothetical protein KKF27_20000 [Gammaproteobacteria bacterium]|nr:hypothetical protein [Gammaproteobacteria bacterium]